MKEAGEEVPAPEHGGEEEASAGDSDKPETSASENVKGDAEEAGCDADKASTDVDMKGAEVTGGEKDGEGEEDKKSEQVEEVKKSETERDGEEMKDKNKEEEKNKTEETAKEAKKDVDGSAVKGAEKKNQVKEVDVPTKDKGPIKETEKQGKPKRKSGPLPSSLSRPRPSARSIRAAAKNDIIAKFQQGAPE